MTKQMGSNDCGLYAIAVATSLAHQVDPTTVIFKKNEMRSHFAECFIKQKITPFPTKKRTRPASSVLGRVTIFMCPICVMPEGISEDETGMVKCNTEL